MKIELNNNKIFFKNGSSVQEIHPFWLRERANGEKYLDKKTQQRLFDPTSLNVEIAIKSARINNDLLEIDFNDGVNSKLNIEKIAEEFSKEDEVIYGIEKVKWNSSFTDFKKYTIECFPLISEDINAIFSFSFLTFMICSNSSLL